MSDKFDDCDVCIHYNEGDGDDACTECEIGENFESTFEGSIELDFQDRKREAA